ncbi:toxin-antitoxin system, toxin component, RelE family [Cedecea davisae DSM 4568]|uniref:Toxin-antitoxin system, toxin component, RelE family n=2 Tax=Cedecea davisae TaxID=158484 RepID=S3J8E0_9ENTR|nr:toxin-antitoxin system, toxin component, RelE family [Cedecea davisae DSM 4568]
MADNMLFIENPIFTHDVATLLTDQEFAQFQAYLAFNPNSGDVIPDSGGLRKIRWPSKGKGKRGGVRVIYFHKSAFYVIRLLLIYQKGIKTDLSEAEKQLLRKLNERW